MKKMLVIRGIIGGLFQLAIIAFLLIVPAGLAADEWGWLRGWQYILCYGFVMILVVIALALFAPNSLEARLRPLASHDQPFNDKVATFLIVAAITLYFVFIPLDVFVWQLLGQPSQMVSILGAIFSACGYALITWTIYTNSFAIPIVEDQSEQGQVLIDTGPYAIVRHPMYLGILPFFTGMGLWLQSWASLPLIGIIVLALVVRIRIEERTLLASLDGYSEFCQRRPYRLLPLVW